MRYLILQQAKSELDKEVGVDPEKLSKATTLPEGTLVMSDER